MKEEKICPYVKRCDAVLPMADGGCLRSYKSCPEYYRMFRRF